MITCRIIRRALGKWRLRISTEELWRSWILSRQHTPDGDILRAYTPIGHVQLEHRKENGCWIISPNWTTDRYATREESRAIHIAVKSYLKALRYAVGTSLLLIRAQKANELYRDQIDEVLGKLYPEDNQEEW